MANGDSPYEIKAGLKVRPNPLTGVRKKWLRVVGDFQFRLRERRPNGTQKTSWCFVCLCNCGGFCVMSCSDFSQKYRKSCGCSCAGTNKIKKTGTASIHGKTGTREYAAWLAMKHRCNNPNNKHFADYGGRGITVCERWQEEDGQGFINFLADMGERPSKGHSIDRIDVNGNYEPDNCRWATRVEQSNNQRHNIYYEYQGERLTINQWAVRFGLKKVTAKARIRKGWSIEKVLTTPIRGQK